MRNNPPCERNHVWLVQNMSSGQRVLDLRQGFLVSTRVTVWSTTRGSYLNRVVLVVLCGIENTLGWSATLDQQGALPRLRGIHQPRTRQVVRKFGLDGHPNVQDGKRSPLSLESDRGHIRQHHEPAILAMIAHPQDKHRISLLRSQRNWFRSH